MIVGSVYVTAGALLLGVPVGAADGGLSGVLLPRRGSIACSSPRWSCWRGFRRSSTVFSALWCSCPLVRALGERWDGSGNAMLTASHPAGDHDPADRSSAWSSPRCAPCRERLRGRAGAGRDARAQRVSSPLCPPQRAAFWRVIVLGVGRAMGETMAVVMVAGNQPRMPKSILQGVRTLTAQHRHGDGLRRPGCTARR